MYINIAPANKRQAIHRPLPGAGAWLQMTSALEEQVTLYDKRAHGRVTAIDTRLSNEFIKITPNLSELYI